MNKKLILFLIALTSILICASPIMAAENNALSDYVLLDFNPFGGNSPNFTIDDLFIEKVKTEHTDSNGKTDKHTDYFLKLNLKSNSDSMDKYDMNITCLDEKNKTIKTIKSYVDKDGDLSIELPDVSKVKGAKISIFDKDGKVIYNASTFKVNTKDNITQDEPKQEKTTSQSSSSGGTYWASSSSGKFHNPSCEWAQKISSKNKVVFHSRDEAINSGYAPCQVCSP